DEIILIILFKTSSQLPNERAFKLCKIAFNQMPKKFYKNPSMVTSTLNMLMKFNDVTNAEKLFNEIEIKDVINYGAIMNGYNINNQPEKCLELFNQMPQKGILPDEITFLLALDACSRIGL